MVSAGDFKNGITIQMDNGIWQIIEFQHVKPGKGAAFVRTKLKNIVSGGVVEKSFRPTEKFDLAHIDRKEYQYLYSDGDIYNFMDTETFEQIGLASEDVGDSLKFVKENEMVKLCSHAGKGFSIEPPITLSLRLQRQSQVLRVIQLQVLQSQLSLRQVQESWFHYSLTRAIRLRLIHVQASIFQELNCIFYGHVKSPSFWLGDFHYLHLNEAHTVSPLSVALIPDISMWSATHLLSEL